MPQPTCPTRCSENLVTISDVGSIIMIEKYCDILVIGNDLPGLITAAFLARRGLSVHLLDTDPAADLERLPEAACLPNIHSKLVRSILGRLNVPEMAIQALATQDATLQVIFPRHRLDILPTPADFYQELDREFGRLLGDLKSFYDEQARVRHQTDVNELFQQLLPWTWKERRLLKKFIKVHDLDRKSTDYAEIRKKDSRLDAFFKAQMLLAYGCEIQTPFAFQAAELFQPGEGEVFGVHAGTRDIKKILIERILQHGGVMRKGVQLKSLLFRSGIFEGAEFDNPQGTILAKYVLWNDTPTKLPTMLPRKWRFIKLRKRCEELKPDSHWASVRFTVDARYVPEPMKANVLDILNPEASFTGGNLLYLQVFREKNAPITKIDAHFLIKPETLDADEADFESIFETIKLRLLSIMPFAASSLKQVFPIKPETQPADTLFPLHENDLTVFRHAAKNSPVYPKNVRSFYDLFRLHYRTVAPNFFLTHSTVFSGLGLEAKLMLGLKVTDLIWQEAEKSKRRAMKSERRIA